MRTDPIIVTGAGHSGTRGLMHALEKGKNVYLGDISHSKREWEFYRKLAAQVNSKLLGLRHHDHNILPKELYWHYHPSDQQEESLHEFIIKEIEANPELSMPPDADVTWVIKSPRTNICLDIWYNVFPEARFLNLVRDGRDVAASIPHWAGSLLRRFDLWRARINRMWHYQRAGLPIIDFRYEDLGNPERLRSLCDTLGISYSQEMQSQLIMSLGRGVKQMRGLAYEKFELLYYGYPINDNPWRAVQGMLSRLASYSRDRAESLSNKFGNR